MKIAIFILLNLYFISVWCCLSQAQNYKKPYDAKGISTLNYNGVIQGGRGDCWFCASLASVASLPKGQANIARMINYGPNNTYIVQFMDSPVQYKVDQKDFKKWNMRDSALWARIIEDAFFQRFTDGTKIDYHLTDHRFGGSCYTALRALTGSSCQSFKVQEMSDDEIFNVIYNATLEQNPMVAATDCKGTKSPLIVHGHVYSILSIDPKTSKIKLRNPWGVNPGDYKTKKYHGVVEIDIPTFKQNFDCMTKAWFY